jgi:hypothetical protein
VKKTILHSFVLLTALSTAFVVASNANFVLPGQAPESTEHLSLEEADGPAAGTADTAANNSAGPLLLAHDQLKCLRADLVRH